MQRYWRLWLLAIALAMGLSIGTVRAQDEEKPAPPAIPPAAAAAVLPQDKAVDPAKPPVIVQNTGGPLSGWYVQADVLILKRNQTNHLAGANELRYNYDAGPRLLVGHEISRGNAIEISWFGLTNMHASGTFIGGGVGAVDTRTRVQNVEANLRHWINSDFSAIAGIRYLNWHERMTGALGDTVTNNNLFGVQIGGDYYRSMGKRSVVDLYGRVGLFTNGAFGRFTGGGVTISDGINRAAMVAEFGMMTTIKVTDRFSVRTGYTFMAVSQIANAPDQFPNFAFTGRVEAHGSAFLHGPVLGGEFRW